MYIWTFGRSKHWRDPAIKHQNRYHWLAGIVTRGSTSRLQAPPVILCSLETAALRGKNTGAGAGGAEIKMLTFSMGVDRMDRIRSENIRVTAC